MTTMTCLSVSLIRPKGETEPGVSPRCFSRRSGEPKESLDSCRIFTRCFRSARLSLDMETR